MERRKRDWSGLTEETAREYYLENYEGMSRTEVQKEDSGFYQKLRKEGWLDILPESKYRDWSGLTEDSAREYYLDNHEGMSRGEVEKEDSGFYTTIYKEGWIDVVFRPFHNMEEFNEYLGESGLLEDLFDEDTMVKDVDKFSEIVKEYCKYNCQSLVSLGDELGIKSLASKLNLKKTEYKFHPEEIEKVHKYMQNPANDRWIEYSLESKL